MPGGASIALRTAAVLGVTGVALGAFGAHGLQPVLQRLDTEAIWKTASLYHLVHAVALLAMAASARASAWLTGLWTAGILIFSGSLYILAVTGFTKLGMITPIGGLAFIAGWLLILVRGR